MSKYEIIPIPTGYKLVERPNEPDETTAYFFATREDARAAMILRMTYPSDEEVADIALRMWREGWG